MHPFEGGKKMKLKVALQLAAVVGLMYGGVRVLNALPRTSDLDEFHKKLVARGITSVVLDTRSDSSCIVYVTYNDGREECVV